jgi:hypothetical protein
LAWILLAELSALLMPLVHSLRLPYPPYLRIIVRRSAVLWLLVRLLLVVALLPFVGREAVHQATWGVPVLLVWLDRRFFRELLLPANLAASELWFWGASLGVVGGLDVLAAVLLQSG